MRYQFQLNNRPAAPLRETIPEAAMDAIDAGFAGADRQGRIVLHDEAEIVTIEPPKVH